MLPPTLFLLATEALCGNTKTAVYDRPTKLAHFRTSELRRPPDANSIDRTREPDPPRAGTYPDSQLRSSSFPLIIFILLLLGAVAIVIVRTLKKRHPVEEVDVGSLLESEDLY
jgi:hypothetical protein